MLKSAVTCNNPLNSDVRKQILIINNCLPVEKAALWLTADKICDRLVYCGIDHALTVDIVSHALKNVNRHDTKKSEEKTRSATAVQKETNKELWHH